MSLLKVIGFRISVVGDAAGLGSEGLLTLLGFLSRRCFDKGCAFCYLKACR